MSDIVVNCPNCNQDYTIDPATLGRQFKCVQCGQTFTATASAAAQPVYSPPPSAPQTPTMSAPVYPQASYGRSTTAPPSYLGEAPPGIAPRSSVAFASFICALLCWIWPVGIAALVLGIIGIGKTRNNQMRGGGMAVTGTVLGAIGLILDPILMFCVGPFIYAMIAGGGQIQEAVNSAKSQQNLTQIGLAMSTYESQNNSAYPPDLETLITAQGLSTNLFVYPGGKDTPAPSASTLESGGHLSYVYLGDGTPGQHGATSMPYSDRVVLYETGPGHLENSVLGLNILYADGHVNFETKATADAVIDKTRQALAMPAAGN